mgnify:CR=1 FL=1
MVEFLPNESFDKSNIVGDRYLGYWVHFRGAPHLRTNLPLQVDLSYSLFSFFCLELLYQCIYRQSVSFSQTHSRLTNTVGCLIPIFEKLIKFLFWDKKNPLQDSNATLCWKFPGFFYIILFKLHVLLMSNKDCLSLLYA